MTQFSAVEVERALMTDPEVGLATWFSEFGRIKKKDGKIEKPKLNPMQKEVCDAVGWCLMNNKPIRLIILKPRQKGCSTITMAVMYWMMCMYSDEAVITGGKMAHSDNLWEIFRRYAEKDDFDWHFKRPVQADKAFFENGARVQKETARNEDAGRSGTFQFLCATEAARWHEGGVADANAVLKGLLKCVPPDPQTCAIMESTAKGPTGFFYSYWQKAVSFEDAKAGKWSDNGFIKIFSPWFDHDDSRIKHEDPARENDIVATYTLDEERMVETYDLEPDQMRWYRWALESECDGDLSEMNREYPATAEEAFHASSNQRFCDIGLKEMRREATQAAPHRRFGILEGYEGLYSWVPEMNPHNAWFVQDEQPTEGLRYLMAVDTMTGEYTDSGDADNHCAVVIRRGYRDRWGAWHKHKVVAKTIYKCQWDIDILAERVYWLSRYYGDCLIVPEINKEMGLTRYLRDWGANIYQRTTDDTQPDASRTKTTGLYGYLTTPKNREPMLGILARHIRIMNRNQKGKGLELLDIDGVKELENFVRKPSGKSEAAEGHHDDVVMALAIGMQFVEGLATPYYEPVMNPILPRDLQMLEDEEQANSVNAWT